MYEFFEKNLKQKKQKKLYREIQFTSGIDFTSNDYLNLSSHPQIRKKMIEALEDNNLSLSSKASPLLGGISSLHLQLEEALKKILGQQGVLSFSSGYQANLGLIPALAKDREILCDELNHASLIDGVRLSQRPYHIFRHNDLNHLESLLKKANTKTLIVTESLFSMEGDFSPLEEISELALKHQALLFVDEAHSTGLFGKLLGGRVSDLKFKNHIITVHTGGKALGSSGAFVGSSFLIKDYLINNCRSFIYSTAPPPLLMVQWLAGLDILEKEPFRASSLKTKSLKWRKKLNLKKSQSPIFPIVLEGSSEALTKAKYLNEQGIFVKAIRQPTVPQGREGLRVVLHYDHTTEQLEFLKQHLEV